MLTPGTLIDQMEEMATDRLPERWIEQANRLKETSVGSGQTESEEDKTASNDMLQQWLEEVYFDEDKKAELSPEDVCKLGELVRKMLWFEPSSRSTASNLLKDTWLSSEYPLRQ